MSIGILPNVNSIKQHRAVKQGISVYSRTTRLTNNQKKKRKKKKELPFQQRKKGGDKHAAALCDHLLPPSGVVPSKTQNHWTLKEAQSLGETRWKKFWDQFDEYDSPSLRCVKQVSGKRKDHRLGKIQVKIHHLRSPYAMKHEDRSQEETERQQRCARGKA